MYVNLIYNIAEIHHKFLSFPTVALPIRISRPLSWKLLASNALKGIVNEYNIKFVIINKDNGTVETSEDQDHPTNLIKITRRSHYVSYPEYYKNESEKGLQSGNLFQNYPELEVLWKRARDIQDLYDFISKEDLYQDGIAYRFMTYLGRDFAKKYNELENAVAKLQLLDLEAYSQIYHVYSGESVYIILTGNSAKDVDKLGFEIQSQPLHGTLSPLIDRNTVRYTPTPGYHGEDSFKFIVTDGIIDSEPAKISLQIISR
jgi:hypothetical protein